MDLSVVIVSYKSPEKLQVTLDAVFASETNLQYEVFVVDNASDDGTTDMISNKFLSKPDVAAKLTYIESPENLGFPKGNNIALKKVSGKYILILNPDTKVAPETFQVMYEFMEQRKDVGIGTCKLVKAGGELDLACRRSFPDPWVSFFRLSGLSKVFPKSKLVASYNLTYKSVDEETEVDACSGAFMFVSRACFEKVGLMDESFYMYGEDLDYCFRAKQAGFKVWYYPKTATVHYKGQSSRKAPKRSLYAFHDAMWIFYRKHLYNKYNRLFSGLVYVGIWGRYYVKLSQNYFRKEKFVSK